MLFNSFAFAIFLPVVFILYWFVFQKNLRWQNILLLVASYYFYAYWDWRFLFLLAFSTYLDYFTGLKMAQQDTQAKKKIWFWTSVIINLGFLAVFKYYNFFVESFADGLALLGLKTDFWTLKVILPVGISFYTFHGLSYVIDIYKNRIEPEKDFVNYAVFVSFFPLLVAGPIERATHLLPQIIKRRSFDYNQSIDGLFLIFWGLFKKVVVADNCAPVVNEIFQSGSASGSVLVLGAVLFAFQIYGDFSGYSDIAIGTAKLFGIDLLTNFRFPYFSRNISEFWRRWHISLSTWFRDYLFIPLGGSKVSKWLSIRNVFIIFLVSGFWHGANWTFIVWGGLHACFFLPSFIFNSNKKYQAGIINPTGFKQGILELGLVFKTFVFATFAWIFFRAETVTQALSYIKRMFSKTLLSIPKLSGEKNTDALLSLAFIVLMIAVEWRHRKKQFVFENIYKSNGMLQLSILLSIVALLFFFTGKSSSFIYFQF
jgi:alginate O-acetyltransferase complex protein AlgI